MTPFIPPARRACLAAAALVALSLVPSLASAADCAATAQALTRDAAQLPKEELANPGDHENTCITLEVNMDFAARVAAHVAQCPASPFLAEATSWSERGARDAAAFKAHRCRRSY